MATRHLWRGRQDAQAHPHFKSLGSEHAGSLAPGAQPPLSRVFQWVPRACSAPTPACPWLAEGRPVVRLPSFLQHRPFPHPWPGLSN